MLAEGTGGTLAWHMQSFEGSKAWEDPRPVGTPSSCPGPLGASSEGPESMVGGSFMRPRAHPEPQSCPI